MLSLEEGKNWDDFKAGVICGALLLQYQACTKDKF